MTHVISSSYSVLWIARGFLAAPASCASTLSLAKVLIVHSWAPLAQMENYLPLRLWAIYNKVIKAYFSSLTSKFCMQS